MPGNIKNYERVKQAEIELDKRIQETNLQKYEDLYRRLFDGLRYISVLFLLGWIIFTENLDFSILLVILFFAFPILCKIYSIVVGSFTIFFGIKIAFSGQFFAIAPALPFTVLNPEVSYFCLGWGFLAASRSTRSKFGFLLAIFYFVGGALGLFQYRSGLFIKAPGIWGAIMTSIPIISLGLLMTLEILLSWQPPKPTE
ncbi:hypothetical protein [Acaryochloris marina]|uniref:hypothetical protein n=1 Tax=Acaryochloris marina TaxID=155978 RepID=UPI001BB077CA|nr:hypothetical protein [Acaryochloris marina]QUY42002.1 hypothetical protein I1H34_22770 [Acaryochloris marina S15]